MKKSLLLFVLSAALPVMAASTCETRVDKHPYSSTKDRVDYCLTPEAEKPADPQAQVIYSKVEDNTPVKEKKAESPRKQVYFDKEGVGVEQDYVGTRKFPAFENETLSEKEKIEVQKARIAEKEAAIKEAERKRREARAAAKASAKKAEEKALADKEKFVETPEGLKVRKSKPKRFMKVQEEPQENELPLETQAASPVASPEDNLYADPLADAGVEQYPAQPEALETTVPVYPSDASAENAPVAEGQPYPIEGEGAVLEDDFLTQDYQDTMPAM